METKFETHPYVIELAAGRPIIEPASPRRTWFNSRRYVNADGSFETVLAALAKRMNSQVDMEKHKPFWRDCNWRNETPENVAVVTVSESRAMRNSVGLPSGTPEYYKAYRLAHADKFKAYSKTYRKRRAAEVEEKAAALRAKLAVDALDAVPDPRVTEMQRRLEELLRKPVDETDAGKDPLA